jgi:transcription-repair coupling factor (superfamily II helicase)
MDFRKIFSLHPSVRRALQLSRTQKRVKAVLPGNSFQAVFWWQFFENRDANLWVVAHNRTEASFLFRDLQNFVSKEHLLFLPASFRHLQNPQREDVFDLNARLQAVKVLTGNAKYLVVTYTAAFLEKIPSEAFLSRRSISIGKGDILEPDFLNEYLFDLGFERVDVVTEPGEFAGSGHIMDVFPYASKEPYRIEFDFDRVAKIKTFDIETQLTAKEINKIDLLGIPGDEFPLVALYRLFKPEDVVYTPSFTRLSDVSQSLPREKYVTGKIDTDFSLEKIKDGVILFSSDFPSGEIIPKVKDLPPLEKKIGVFIDVLKDYASRSYKNYITGTNKRNLKRLQEMLTLSGEDLQYDILPISLHEGFRDDENLIAVFPEHSIFGRPDKKPSDRLKQKKQKRLLSGINEWQPGDYIVHADYGIGIYEGLVKIDKGGERVDAVKLRYKDGDVLYVGIHSLFKLSKYRGKDGKPPRIYRMGSAAWERAKQRTKKRIKRLAFDLIKLYAERKQQEGFAFAPDSPVQLELEASFMYEDTPDQRKATEEVKRDMESPRPMDRLVCGDVGFGKTEVAIRAAFKAVDNGKQVAVLVPTTILAFQHYQTFTERMKNFPVVIDYLNRFRTAKERTEILEKLASGEIDIIIGTHALASDKVKFKDLGLLIIDEEQKFGVNIKEKIKQLKKNIDVLTLTATPIPRTLQFSLMGERDLSVINTPPPNRFPVETRIIKFDKNIIREAIEKELARGGQVFFVHHRIENINEMAGLIQSLVPDAEIAVAHGRVEGKKLEKIMLDFRTGKYDILLSTAIVESGLDVPNANTMIVNNAQHFGLADLHQLRGRVGRSNRKAYCYFVIPSYETLTEEARKRIETLERYTSLGDGFEIAMKDLEIRGAGDLLGAEQSGFINELGFEMYHKILNEAVEELKREEFAGMFDEAFKGVSDVQIQTDRSWQFPDEYIRSGKERMHYYRRLNEAQSEEELDAIRYELEDRFGKPPVEAENLLKVMSLRFRVGRLGFEKLLFRKNYLSLYFTGSPAFARTDIWKKILEFATQNPDCCRIKQKDESYYLRFENVETVGDMEHIIKQLYDAVLVG